MNKEEIIDMIKDTGFCTLATLEDNHPRVRPMMPYLTEEGSLLLALLAHSRTIQQIKKNPLVEVCFVDRKMWFCRISGKATITQDINKKRLVWDNVPMLRQYFSGPEDSNFVLLEIITDTVEGMSPQQKKPDIFTLKN